jgi:hypothetical protein
VAWDHAFENILRPYTRLVAPTDPIDDGASFADLGVDSLGILGLIVDSEEVFGVEIPLDLLSEDALAGPAAFWRILDGLIAQTPAR